MSLYEQTELAVDISSAADVMEYTYTGDAPKSVLCRVLVGSDDAPISGNGAYSVLVYINDSSVQPDSNVIVRAGVTKALMQSRELLLINGDTLVIQVLGKPADTAVDVVSKLEDMTPLTRAEVYGMGAISVDHNYGGVDRYQAVRETGAGVDNVQIQAFLRSDYEAGNRSASYVKGEVRTTADGRWAVPMMLDAGSYILVFFKQGQYGPNTAGLTVA